MKKIIIVAGCILSLSVVISLFIFNYAGKTVGNELNAKNVGYFNEYKSNALKTNPLQTRAYSSVKGGTQTVTTKLSSNDYQPIVVQAGLPVKLIITAQSSDINGCNQTLVIPEYNITKKISKGENVIEFTPDKEGVVPFSCWMGMINSQIIVVDDINNIDEAKVQEAIENAPQVGAGCCGR